MKILFIGDIFGKAGRETVRKLLGEVRKEHKPDLIIANAENLSHGNGFLPMHIEEMRACGIDFFTTGNHVWDKKDGVEKLNDEDFPVIRPANFPSAETPGKGYAIVEAANGSRILVVNLIGRVFMDKDYDCPFRMADKILKEVEGQKFAGIFVDFHAETTSEKAALAYYLDGRVTAVVGTHTHVPTADARLLENGTAYMTDAGMTGPLDSVIGLKKEVVLKLFLTQMPVKHEPEEKGRMTLSGALIEIDEKQEKALNINHIQKFYYV